MNKRILKRINDVNEKIDILRLDIGNENKIGELIDGDRYTLLMVQYELLIVKYDNLQNKYNKETKDLQIKLNEANVKIQEYKDEEYMSDKNIFIREKKKKKR